MTDSQLRDFGRQVIELHEKYHGVKWCEPFLGITERGLLISLTDDDAQDKLLTWEDFENSVMNGHPSDVAKEIKLLEDFVSRLKVSNSV